MLGDEFMSGAANGIGGPIGLSAKDRRKLELALRILRNFDRSSISASDLEKDKYLGEKSVAELLSSGRASRRV